MTEAVITVFMIFATIICAYAIVVVTREIILDGQDRRAENEARRMSKNEPVKCVETNTEAVATAAAEAAAKAAAVATEKAAEKVAAEAVKAVAEVAAKVSEEREVIKIAPETVATTYAAVAQEEEAEEVEAEAEVAFEEAEVADDGSIQFKSNARESLEEKYEKLDATMKGYYDAITAYAMAKDGAKQFKNVRYEEYKGGKTRLVRMLIKRGVVICEFILPNADFKTYISENKVNVKHAPSVIKVSDNASLQAVKDSIDITMQAAEEEREYKKQQAREKRRIARANERAAAKAAKAAAEAPATETAEA